jgi:hypothetical protein
MTRLSWLVVPSVAVAALVSACESSSVVSPRAPIAASMSRSDASSLSCIITLPAPVILPLPAVREVAREINEAFANPASSVNCGTIQGIGERMNRLAEVLDRSFADQNLDAACGISGGLVNELEALVKTGRLNPTVTHPPESGPNVVDNVAFISSMFCEHAGK